ncbi:hypothetical protein EV126DRAFT_405262 [Verticillium dahliae]|nr:hypothetical protein EV126DRAFT_434052 [Verticillium dahliae]KAH6709681.1 hypothetical protein EV126DRAFT_405262 [Verticillium dahliae]
MLHLAPFRLVMPAKQALFFSLPCPQTKACHVRKPKLAMSASQSLPCPQAKACHVRKPKLAMSASQSLPCPHAKKQQQPTGNCRWTSCPPSLSPCFKLHGTETRAYKGSFAHALIEVRSSSKLRRCCFKPFFVGLIVSGGLDSHFFPCVCLSTARPLVCKTICNIFCFPFRGREAEGASSGKRRSANAGASVSLSTRPLPSPPPNPSVR